MKRSKLFIAWGSWNQPFTAAEVTASINKYALSGALWHTAEEADGNFPVIHDHTEESKSKRLVQLEAVRQEHPNARYFLVNMEKGENDPSGKIKYEVVDL